MTKRDDLIKYFEGIDENKRALAIDTIDEYLFFIDKINELRKLPLIRIHARDASRQQTTPAAKLIKDYSQAVDNKRKTLLMILYRVEGSAADELLNKLKEFE